MKLRSIVQLATDMRNQDIISSSEAEAIHAFMTLPPALEEDVARWRHRPSMAWLRAIYEQYRRPAPVTVR